MPETIVAIPSETILFSDSIGMILIISSKPLPRIAGMLNKKEKRAAASRSNPRNKPAVMVAPDREVPGINANA